MSNESIAGFISGTGWLTVIVGGIASIILLIMPGFSAVIALIALVASVTSGIAVVGFGRIILLLSQIQASIQIRSSTVVTSHQPSRQPYIPQPENRWFIHRGRRVEITREGPALVDGQKFDDAEAAKAFLNEKYPDSA